MSSVFVAHGVRYSHSSPTPMGFCLRTLHRFTLYSYAAEEDKRETYRVQGFDQPNSCQLGCWHYRLNHGGVAGIDVLGLTEIRPRTNVTVGNALRFGAGCSWFVEATAVCIEPCWLMRIVGKSVCRASRIPSFFKGGIWVQGLYSNQAFVCFLTAVPSMYTSRGEKIRTG